MRKSGILMHISSLPSPYGIGTMGKEAYDFINFLEKSGQKVWQVLPIGHTSFGDSPYQAYSSYAGNPYFIDLNMLIDEGLLEKGDVVNISPEMESRVDYGHLYRTRFDVLKKAVKKFEENVPADYYTFLDENRFWLDDYAEFMAIKNKMQGTGRDSWPAELRSKSKNSVFLAEDEAVKEFKVIQYLFFKQWYNLKKYANEKGIEIIGDLPIYCASDSADVWAEPEVFMLDENYLPSLVAGCPPDGFSPKGQRWGNPLYDWKRIEERSFDWWVARIKYALRVFDTVRIDHFRGFDSFFAIDAQEDDAIGGKWLEGPKMKLFDALKEELGENLPIIAEDLGFLTESVKKLLADTNFPGMKIIEFAFDPREKGDYLPHNYTPHSVCYVGTHDNDTAIGWYESVDDETREIAREYLNLTKKEGIAKGLMRGAMSSVSDLCVLCMQDVLSLGSEARMNTPSKMGGNWQWRMKKADLTDRLADDLYKMTKLYGRG